ncbi:MAG TPA: DUF1549 and DUF1553 domain-containing protein [Pirellulaceae bacterium]|nr:DUF1549 and DUF1553 domain-containing protein [Pirellulaceae bacterium]
MRNPLCCVLIAVLLLGGVVGAAEPLVETAITAADREHWSFRPLRRPAVPSVNDAHAWQRTPLDAFILAKLKRSQQTPAPMAERSTLLRRLALDLTGLPPTPEQRAAFLTATAPDAYEQLVDALLASPQRGEHLAQHWLDLARFAETDGFEHDKTRAHAWKYRDWVVKAFNRDLPYREFVAQQIAGDELHPGDVQAGIATMFCLSGPDMPDINNQEQRRHDLLNELTGTVGSTFLGLQLGCAQCHDHKYDPLSQADFYRLRAIFAPAVQVKKEMPVGQLRESSREAQPEFVYLRGEMTRPGAPIEPAFPRIVNSQAATITPPAEDAPSTGRRAALAAWLTRPDHPLTARVLVNRLWQQHFGRGLSNTPGDFGLVGEEPSHPELLDYLACELIDHDFSIKHVERLIVTSAVYRQASVNAHQGASPPNVSLYAAYPRRRLQAEAIRDAMLAVSGELNLAAGGPGVMPPLPKEVESTLLPGQWKTTQDRAEHARRSVFLFARRNLRYPLFEAFDRPSANETCTARHASTTAPQALLMLNSDFALARAQHLAGRVLVAAQGDLSRAAEPLWLLAYSRQPTPREQQLLAEFITSQTKQIAQQQRPADQLALPEPRAAMQQLEPAPAAALVDACLALLNTSEFVYID